MPTTCPRCGTRSSAVSQACAECGHDLYRVSYPDASPVFPLNLRTVRSLPMAARLTASAAVLVVGAGVLTGLLVGGEEEPVSREKLPSTAVPRDPPPSVPPSSPEPSKSKTPPKPSPAAPTPSPTTSSPKPSPSKTSAPPIPGFKEAEWAIELAEELQRKYGTPSPSNGSDGSDGSDGSNWEGNDQGNGYGSDGDYQYDESYSEGEYDSYE